MTRKKSAAVGGSGGGVWEAYRSRCWLEHQWGVWDHLRCLSCWWLLLLLLLHFPCCSWWCGKRELVEEGEGLQLLMLRLITICRALIGRYAFLDATHSMQMCSPVSPVREDLSDSMRIDGGGRDGCAFHLRKNALVHAHLLESIWLTHGCSARLLHVSNLCLLRLSPECVGDDDEDGDYLSLDVSASWFGIYARYLKGREEKVRIRFLPAACLLASTWVSLLGWDQLFVRCSLDGEVPASTGILRADRDGWDSRVFLCLRDCLL